MHKKKAIIVPGITDMNKGDQALVWESYRLIQDLGNFESIAVMSLGDTQKEYEDLCSQTNDRGIRVIKNILKHPRRGKHYKKRLQKEGFGYFLFQAFNASIDYIRFSFLKKFINSRTFTKNLYSKEINNTIEELKTVDTIFVKGGGFLHAHGEKTAPYFTWYSLFYMSLGNKLKKNVVILPNSFGPFDGYTVKSQMIKTLSNCKLIMARENISSIALSKLIQRDIPVRPDLGFYLDSAEKRKGEVILEKYGFNLSTDKIVGMTVRPWRFPGSSNPAQLFDDYLSSLKDVIIYLHNKGYKIALFNQSIGPNAHEDDRNAIERLQEICDNKSKNLFTWVNENLTCDVLKAVYSNTYFFIGTRFHSLIFSMTAGIPSISIAYGGNKGVGIMNDFDLGDYVIKINDINSEVLIQKFEQAIIEYEIIQKKLQSQLPILAQARRETITLINQKLSQS